MALSEHYHKTTSLSLINNYWIRLSHDIKNYPDQGQCYLPKPKAEANNVDQGLDNS